jgi:uncharacterized repeat protein (TIGR03899 family)
MSPGSAAYDITRAVADSTYEKFGTLAKYLGKPIEEWLQPWLMHRKVKYEMRGKIIAEATKEQIAVMRQDHEWNLEDRASERCRREEIRRQQNIENIVVSSVEQIPSDQTPIQINDDWSAQFIENCKDISDETMQKLWSKILAGELSKPGSCSLKTMAILRTMNKSDAELFSTLKSFVWESAESQYIVINFEKMRIYSNNAIFQNFDYNSLIDLEHFGLIHLSTPATIIQSYNEFSSVSWRYFDKSIKLTKRNSTGNPTGSNLKIDVGEVHLTKSGKDLMRLVSGNPMDSYIEAAVKYFQSRFLNVQFEPQSSP